MRAPAKGWQERLVFTFLLTPGALSTTSGEHFQEPWHQFGRWSNNLSECPLTDDDKHKRSPTVIPVECEKTWTCQTVNGKVFGASEEEDGAT